MANGVKTYQIQINGITESVKAVESLNKELNELEARIKALEGKSVGVKASGGGGGSSSSKASLSEEEKLAKQIEQIDAKRVAYSKEIYQNYLAAKDVLKETVTDQKSIAASERLQANSYSNTIQGMKQELADIKSAMQTVDLGDTGKMDAMVKRANELNEALKKIEESYGQFGRNVGNYATAANGFQKVRISVGGTIREFNSAREAIKTLNNELKTMAINGQQDTEAFKELRQAVMQLESAANDAKKPMDNIMDTMQGLVAIANVSHGLSAFFGIDDDKIQRSIQKLVALQNALNGMQAISKQMQSNEGIGKIFSLGNASIDRFVGRLTGARVGMNGLVASTRGATIAVRGLSVALKGIGIGLVVELVTRLMSAFEDMIKDMDSAEKQISRVDEALNTLNASLKTRNDLLATSYMKGEISDEEFLSKTYQDQSYYLAEQINLLRERAALMNQQNERGFFNMFWTGTVGGGFTGQHMKESQSVESYSWLNDLSPNIKVTVDDLKQLEEEFRKCQEAWREGEDYFSKWGNGIGDWINSLFTTVADTERVLHGLGNIKLSDFVASFADINKQFKDGKISAEEFGNEVGKLKAELNSNDVLQSVIANLDKYIPDEGVRKAVENIINQIIRLDDAFNMTSPEQIHHWMQVRIDAMAEGTGKIKAQIDADEKYEIAQYGKTQEQINLIHAKYNRKRLDALKKYNDQAKEKAKKHANELEAVEKELNSLRIENMKEGLDKQLAQLEEERRQRLQKAKTNGIKVEELTLEINKLYDKKILDAKKEWAYNVEQVYINMWNKIYQINHKNAQMNFDAQLNEIERQYDKLQDIVAKDFSGVGLDYSNKGYSVEKKPKRNKSADSDNASDFKYKVLKEKEEEYTKRLRKEFDTRTDDRKKYYSEIEKLEIEEENKLYDISVKKANENLNNELRNLKNSYSKEDKEIKNHYDKGIITLEQYNEAVARLEEERSEQEAQIQIKYQNEAEKREIEHNDKIVSIKQQSDNSVLQNYKDFIDKLSNIDSSDVIKNGMGFVNISATKKRNKELIDAYRKLGTDITTEINKLKEKLNNSELTKKQREEIEKLINTYSALLSMIGIAVNRVQSDTKKTLQTAIAEIGQYVQAALDSFNQIMSAVWQAEDNAFDKEQEQLDKLNEELDKKLDEQQDIVQQHKSAIDSIEDELATARGDRRQHLIDQLNAEMAAQRAAQKQEQKIQKEKEAAQKKQDALEKKRKKAQYQRDMLQAIVNGAMAVTYAAMNAWPVPAIPMMALAAATTAVQLGIMAANKPYAKGGVLEGPSHKQGGIPVGNTGIEVEGKEYVIRKKSTTPNVELLDMINRSERKLNLDDFIDFYTSGKIKKNISSMSPRTRFAEGGTIPTITNDYAFDDRLLTAFEDYSNRPVYVSVVDINNRQDAVKNVQVLAGIE